MNILNLFRSKKQDALEIMENTPIQDLFIDQKPPVSTQEHAPGPIGKILNENHYDCGYQDGRTGASPRHNQLYAKKLRCKAQREIEKLLFEARHELNLLESNFTPLDVQRDSVLIDQYQVQRTLFEGRVEYFQKCLDELADSNGVVESAVAEYEDGFLRGLKDHQEAADILNKFDLF